MAPTPDCGVQAGCAGGAGASGIDGSAGTSDIDGAAGISGGGAGTSGTEGGSAGSACTSDPAPPPPPFATWPMPNPTSSGLPNPASYDTSRAGVVIEGVTGLMWEANPGDAMLDATQAAAYCADLRLDDHCDWRMPSRIELVSLVDFTRRDPAYDTAIPATTGDFLTTSTLRDFRWHVASDGATRVFSTTFSTTGRVRCVRTHVAHPAAAPRYAFTGDAPDDTATDHGTGLTWQRRPNRVPFSFAEAKDYCAGLTTGGGGFRVPSMKELQTVLDEQAPFYTDPDVFPDLPSTDNLTFWTSTLSVRSAADAWFIRGGYALNIAADAGVNAKFYVRCVK